MQKAIFLLLYTLILKQQHQQFVVPYVLIVAFHPALSVNRIIIQRSYAHSLEQLTSLNYFSEDQMKFIVVQVIRQLKDIAIDVSKRKCKNTMGQMYCIESPLVKKHYLIGLIKNIGRNI